MDRGGMGRIGKQSQGEVLSPYCLRKASVERGDGEVVGHGGRCRQHFANQPGGDMNLFDSLRFWWKAMVNRSRMGREVEEEFKFHIDAYVADLVRQGIAPADAQRKAHIDLGRADTQNEKYRDAA